MTAQHYSSATISVSASNGMAFKQGKVTGPCRAFQDSLQGQHASMRQAKILWGK